MWTELLWMYLLMDLSPEQYAIYWNVSVIEYVDVYFQSSWTNLPWHYQLIVYLLALHPTQYLYGQNLFLSFKFFLILIFTLFCFAILYWFCHTLTWIHHGCTWVPNPEPPSHLPSHIISLDHPRAPAPSILYPVLNIDWRFSYMIVYMFQCHSPKSSRPLPLPQSPKVCSIHLCLFCCLAYRVILTIFLNSIYMR